MTMGMETHVGLGALDGKLIVGVTLAGYDATPDKIARLVDLARTEVTAARRPWLPALSQNTLPY